MGLCNIVQIYIMPALLPILHNEFMRGGPVCQPVTFQRMVFFGITSRRWTVRFVVNEGDPSRIFDTHFTVHPENANIGEVIFQQVTRYDKYKACTPPGIHPSVCVCKL